MRHDLIKLERETNFVKLNIGTMENQPTTDLEKVLKGHSRLIEGLEKMVLNMSAVHSIQYWYSCLSNFPVSPNMYEDIMQMDAFTTSIIISYGRLFGEGDGATKLDKQIVPESLQTVHEDILNLRHARYAHHGKHHTIKTNFAIQQSGSSIVINPGITFGMYLGAPKKWAPLFQWLSKYMYETLYKRLDLLTSKTGLQWKIETGPAPAWIESEEQ